MARPSKPLGDLEYEKFNEGSDGEVTIKTVEQSPFDHLTTEETTKRLLTEILDELKYHSTLLSNLFQEAETK